MDGAVCAGALALNVLATSIFLNLPIPEDSGWALLRPFALIVTFSAVVHVPKQCKVAGAALPAVRYAVLGGLLLSTLLVIGWTSHRLYQESHRLMKPQDKDAQNTYTFQPQHAQLLAVLVLELVLLGAVVIMLRSDPLRIKDATAVQV